MTLWVNLAALVLLLLVMLLGGLFFSARRLKVAALNQRDEAYAALAKANGSIAAFVADLSSEAARCNCAACRKWRALAMKAAGK